MKHTYIYIIMHILICNHYVLAERITVFGAGYVGLVTTAIFSQCGHHVDCFDVDTEKIHRLQNKQLPIHEPHLKEVLFNKTRQNISFSSDIDNVPDNPITYICVGTPTTKGSFDARFMYSAIDTILTSCKNTQIICIKSTVQPGTLATIKQQLIEHHKKYIDLIYNPEFMREGSALEDVRTKNPLIIAGESDEAINKIAKLYQPLINTAATHVIKTSFETAEIIKYAWNAFSALRITFVNELASLCTHYNADIFTIIKALACSEKLLPTKILQPGPGFGGSCLPKDTTAFTRILKHTGNESSLTHQTIQSNNHHKQNIIATIFRLLGDEPCDKRIALLGLSFKAHTDDIRNAPSIDIIQALIDNDINVCAYDPQAMQNMCNLFPEIEYADSPYTAARDADCIVLLTEWPEFEKLDLQRIAHICRNKVLFDTKNLYSPREAQQYGFCVHNLGRTL